MKQAILGAALLITVGAVLFFFGWSGSVGVPASAVHTQPGAEVLPLERVDSLPRDDVIKDEVAVEAVAPAATVPPVKTTGTVSGRVFDARGEPLAGQRVSVAYGEAVTNLKLDRVTSEDGFFIFQDIPTGRASVSYGGPLKTPVLEQGSHQTIAAEVLLDQVTIVDIVLGGERTLRGELTYPEEEPDATLLMLSLRRGNEVASTLEIACDPSTKSYGTFAFQWLAPDLYTLRITWDANGIYFVDYPVDLTLGDVTLPLLELKEEAFLHAYDERIGRR